MINIKKTDGTEAKSLNIIHDNLISFYKNIYPNYDIVTKNKVEDYFLSNEYELRSGMNIKVIETVYNKSIVELNIFWKNELKNILLMDDSKIHIKNLIKVINSIYYDGYKPFIDYAANSSIDELTDDFKDRIANPDICRIDILKNMLESLLIEKKKEKGEFNGYNVYDYANYLVQSGKYENHLVLLEKLVESKKDSINNIIANAIEMSKKERHEAICEEVNDIVGAYKAAEDYYRTHGKIYKLFKFKYRKFMKGVKIMILKSMTAVGYTLVSDDTFDEFVEYHSKAKTGHDFLEYKMVLAETEKYINAVLNENNI